MMVSGTKGNGATATSTDEAPGHGPMEPGECGVGVVAGAWQQRAAAEHEPACGRGGCGRGRGVRACERAQRVGACVMTNVLARMGSRRQRAGGVGARRGVV